MAQSTVNTMNEGILFLCGSVIMDVTSNILLKKSVGFRQKLWGFCALACVFAAFFFLSQAIKTMEVSTAYAMWGAAGMLTTGFIDIIFYQVRLKNSALFGMLLMIIGIIIIQTLN